MARSKNSADTVKFTISTTPRIREYLQVLVDDGTFGKNIAEVAERLLAESIRSLRGSSDLVDRLAKAQRKELIGS